MQPKYLQTKGTQSAAHSFTLLNSILGIAPLHRDNDAKGSIIFNEIGLFSLYENLRIP